MSVIGHIKNPRLRMKALREHRLQQFEVTFDKFIAGDVPASYVATRANKMLEIGISRR
jgi:hypothetical protein